MKSNNLHRYSSSITANDRHDLLGHDSYVVWLTGLSGSGKSTIASRLQEKLHEREISSYILDGDNIRLGLNKDLSFADEDRSENIRRIAEVAHLFVDAGLVTICSFISPFIADREIAKNIIGAEKFIEVFVNCDVKECERRDVKGLYAKARSGEIKKFTGIDSAYERPLKPAIEVNTEESSVDECVSKILNKLTNSLNVK